MRGEQTLGLVRLSAGPGKGSRVRCAVCWSVGVRWQGAEGKRAKRGKVCSAQRLALAERWGQAEKGGYALLWLSCGP